MDAQRFGRKVRERRTELGLSQTGLGQQVDELPTTISKWENGHHMPSIAKLPRLARALGTSVDYLLDLDVEPSAS